MTRNERIVKNFKDYDLFLTKLNSREKKIALSLKMMYSIHMENNRNKQGFLEYLKQFTRFLVKFFFIPFTQYEIKGKKKDSYLILSNSKIEVYVANRLNLALVNLKVRRRPYPKNFYIYIELVHILYLLYFQSNLNKKSIILLSHRLIDYLLVYHTLDIVRIKGLLVENDRDPKNLALIHCLRENAIKTIKYDNWMIGPIHYNDVYCEYYFYPSLYHKNIIASFPSNQDLKYRKGGFFDWDRLNDYQWNSKKKIIYFTQLGIELSQHKQYIYDIIDILKILPFEYQLIIKIHPRERSEKYEEVLDYNYPVEFISECADIYQLISEAKFCFSIFSTISLEAKHIIENSYFINYDYQSFETVDYKALKLDLITNQKDLKKVLNMNYLPIGKKLFIEENNCSFPYTTETMEKILADDKK